MGAAPSVLLPALGVAVSAAITSLAHFFRGTPNPSNNTLLQAEQHAREAEHEAQLRTLEQQRAAAEEAARREREQAQALQDAADTLKREAEQRERTHAAELQRAAEQAAAREAAISAAAATREAELEAARAAAESAHRRGIRPVVWPTLQQIEDAKRTLRIDPKKLHFAVCGASGSGKSSLINALRGLRRGEPGAAETGFVETTREIARYPDPRAEVYPYSRFVWYDVPGAGTLSVPDWQYFNDFGLFVFDFVVLVYDARFTKIDVGILENCRRFNIPTFIVRSKSDQHIRNEMDGCEEYDEDDPEEVERVYAEVKKRYVKETLEDAKRNLELMVKENPELEGMQTKRVYLVSSQMMYGLLATTPGRKKKNVDMKKVIHEVELVEDMLETAKRRRYEEGGVVQGAKDVVGRAEGSLRGLVTKLSLRGGDGSREEGEEDGFVTV